MLLTIILLVLFIVSFVATAMVDAMFRRRLRTCYPDVWQRLGAPSFLRNNSVRNCLRLEKYLWASQYRSLADSELTALARRLKMLFLLYSTSFVSIILLVFVA